jgi:hypothetical protein
MILQVLHRPVTWTLLIAVLVMFGATTGSAVAHDILHAHHTAAMHGTGVCAWMCVSAGTVTTAPVLLSVVRPVEFLSLSPTLYPVSVWTLPRLHTRAPPFHC